MRTCSTLTVEEMLCRLSSLKNKVGNSTPDTAGGETNTPDTGAGTIPSAGGEISAPSAGGDAAESYSLPEISELAGIPLYQLRYLRRRALLRSSEAKDPFGYTPGERHRVRVKISDLMDFLVVYSVGRGCGCACRGSVYCDRCVDP